MTPYVSLHLAAAYACYLAIMRAAPLILPPTRVLYVLMATGLLSVLPPGAPEYAWRPLVKFALVTCLFVVLVRGTVSRRSIMLGAAFLGCFVHLELDEFVEAMIDVDKQPDHWLLVILTPVLLVVSYTTISSASTRFTMVPTLCVYAATEAYLQSVYAARAPVLRHALAGVVCVLQLVLYALLFRLPCAACTPAITASPRKFISVSDEEHEAVAQQDRAASKNEQAVQLAMAAAAAASERLFVIAEDQPPPPPPARPPSPVLARPLAVPEKLAPPPPGDDDENEVSLL